MFLLPLQFSSRLLCLFSTNQQNAVIVTETAFVLVLLCLLESWCPSFLISQIKNASASRVEC
jgi:hypothetical protein